MLRTVPSVYGFGQGVVYDANVDATACVKALGRMGTTVNITSTWQLHRDPAIASLIAAHEATKPGLKLMDFGVRSMLVLQFIAIDPA